MGNGRAFRGKGASLCTASSQCPDEDGAGEGRVHPSYVSAGARQDVAVRGYLGRVSERKQT